MVRRIGFGGDEAGRRPDRRAGQIRPPAARDYPDGSDSPDGGLIRWFMALFMLAWLACWTAGIVFAVSLFTSAAGESLGLAAFLVVWIVFAVIGWFFAAGVILRLIRGQPHPAAASD